jgi:PST family polysaccharide transporter
MNKLKNIGWMFLMQILVYPIQLLIIPFLINELGIETYGNYVYYLAVVGILIPIIDFGTSISLQVNFSNLDKKSKQIIISEIIGFKLFIVFIISFFICFLLLITEVLDYSILILAGWVIYSIFSSDFYYLAELKNKNLFLRQLYQKILYFASVFPLIYITGSAEAAFFCLSLSYLFSTYITYSDLRRDGYNLVPIFSLNSIKNTFKNNILYFTNNFANVGFSSVNVYFIEFNLGFKAVGNFSILESLNRACLSFITSINSVLFPLLSKEMNKKFFLQGLIILPIYIAISFVIYLNRQLIFDFFKVDSIFDSTIIIMLVVLCLDALSKFLGYNFLGSIGKGNLVNITNIIGITSYYPVYLILKHNLIYKFEWNTDVDIFALTYLICITLVLSMRIYFNYKYLKIV